MPNATVTLTSLGTDQARTTTTGAEGTYKFGFLPLGAYKLQIEAAGFNTAQVPSITIIVTETAVMDQVLQVGTQSQQVVVTGETEEIQTASSSVGTLVAGTTLSNLPLTTRNYTTLLGLAAGSNVGVFNATLMGRGTQDPVVNGALSTQNNYQQDGASLVNTGGTGTGADSGGATTGMGIVNPDSIQEFKIQTSSFDAGYGRNAGANVNVVTKSGTNQFHGTAYEFFRNTILNANDFFRSQSPPVNGVPNNTRQVLNQNQFGGSLGGPVKKDKLFFFASYQKTWQKNGSAAAGYSTPTLVGLPAGDRSTAAWVAALGAAFCPGGSANVGSSNVTKGGGVQVACNGSNINPVALNILRLQTPGSAGAGGYYVPGSSTGINQPTTFSVPAHYFENQGVGNFDYVVNSRNTISGRYFYSATETDGTIGTGTTSSTISQGVPGSPGSVRFPTMYMVGKLTSIVSTNVVNEVRASLQRSVVYDYPGFVNADGSLVTNTQLGIRPVEPTYDVSNRFTISGLMALGTGVAVARKLNTSWELADQISWSHGKHTIRAGFEFERDRLNWYFPALAGGGNANETFQTFQDFLLGLPGCSAAQIAAGCSATAPLPGTNGSNVSNIANGGTSTSITAPGGDNHFFRTPYADAFVQDDFKVSSRLTLNLGMRWEYNGLFYDAYGNATNVWPSLINTVNLPVALGGTLGNAASCGAGSPAGCVPGTLAGFVVPANFNASLYAPPTVGGLFTNTQNVPTQNRPPRDALAPRFGFAWRPLASDRFVVRGGAGIFYDRSGIAGYNSAVVQNFPYAVPAFQASGAANYAASEAVPYPTAVAALAASPSTGGLGWAAATRWFNAATSSSSALNVLVMPPNFQVPTTYEWNLQTQYEFRPTWVLEVGYVGSHSIHQLLASIPGGSQEVDQLNVPALATATSSVNGISTNTAANAALRVPYLGFATAGLAELGNLGKTLFDSAQVTVRKQMSHGLTMQAAYTWARALTTADHFLYNNPNIENYGPSSYYRPQRLTISYGWDIPSGHHEGLMGKFVNGWNLAGVTIVQDGLPLTITNTTGGAVYGFSSSAQTSEAEFAPGMGPANIGTSGSVRQRLGGTSAAQGYFNKAAFTTIPNIGAINGVGGATGWGNSGIGNILGPGQFNFDATLQKTTRVGGIHEDATLVFRTELFNVFNHPQFNAPSGSQLDASNAAFGQINSTSVNPRLIQFALKYIF
ncbi:MAG: carboxypeptidase-like regulatory domain-containing protein [Candidatus Acidiferrales bacterium]